MDDHDKSPKEGGSNFNKQIAVGATGIMLAGSAALASPPAMPAITMPIDIASVVAGAALVGGTILLAWAGPRIGFGLAKSLVGKVAQIFR